MLLDRTETLTPEQLGLQATRPEPAFWKSAPITVDMFEGKLPSSCRKSAFFIHGTEDRHLAQSHSIGEAVLILNKRGEAQRRRMGKPTVREAFVNDGLKWTIVGSSSDKLLYSEIVQKLTKAAGTAVVNAHIVTSKLTGDVSYGIYPALLYFPESFVDRKHIPTIQATIATLAANVRSLGDPTDDWFYGLGALTGIRPYTNYFSAQNDFPFTNGNTLTGCMVAEGIQRLVLGWIKYRGVRPSVGIVGASGSTGMITVANVVDWFGGKLTIAARDRKPLELIADQLPQSHLQTSIVSGDSAAEIAARTCDIVIYLVSDPLLKVDPRVYRPNAIIYDPSRPRLHTSNDFINRPDVRLLDGPSVHIPGTILRPGLNNYDANEALSCMAQTAYHSVSGDREFLMPPLRASQFDCEAIQHQSIRFMARVRMHGFTITPWERWLDRKYSIEEIFSR